MKAEYKLQIDVIKGERIFYKFFDDKVLVVDGHVGVYLNKSELKIDVLKMNEIKKTESELEFEPSYFLSDIYQDASVTRSAKIIGSRLAIKIKSDCSDDFTYINNDFLKMFKGYTGIKISTNKEDAVAILKYGTVYGIIMPIRVSDDYE